MRTTLEEERRALAAFVSKFDSLELGIPSSSSSSSSLASSTSTLSVSSSSSLGSISKLKPPMPTMGGAAATYAERRAAVITLAQSQSLSQGQTWIDDNKLSAVVEAESSPLRRPPSTAALVARVLEESPMRMSVKGVGEGEGDGGDGLLVEMDIMREEMPEEADGWRDVSFDFRAVGEGGEGEGEDEDDDEVRGMLISVGAGAGAGEVFELDGLKGGEKVGGKRIVFGDKENVDPGGRV